MKRTRLLQMRPQPGPEPEPGPASRSEPGAPLRITVSVLQDRSFHLLPTPHVVSHLRRDPKILRQWFPMTLGKQRPYVVTLAGQGWQQAITVTN
ncbi:hypothetical protein [Thermogemmatispora onikobensis]|uniref:hypothetical protein n=1 Tax=Thermogemmatispora onikobensis TaxID=732234 RepID=UPI0008536497|nr:hypothetical protein [Thermogemmatispora onikobensis]